MAERVVTHYLQMLSESELRPSPGKDELRFEEAEVPCPELNRFFYTAIGGDWYWTDRLGWSYREWQEYLESPDVETWVGLVGGNPVGYVELKMSLPDSVEIAYFGLLRQFTGRGYGGDLLSRALRRCWSLGPERVLVDTCDLDGPHALANYRSRGFRVYRTEEEERDLLPEPPGPWPGGDPTG